MKTIIYLFLVSLLFSATAFAATCQVQEDDGVQVSASTKIEAEKAAWKACIDRKVSKRERLRGPVDTDTALLDAEACMNANIVCR